jgi:hypothetical protein
MRLARTLLTLAFNYTSESPSVTAGGDFAHPPLQQI